MEKKVLIVGVGALGSHVALFLRNEADLKVVDFDRVEQKNVLSQFHSRPSVGKNKAQGLRDSMKFLFGTAVEVVPHKLTAANVREVASGADVIVDCLDNGEGRRVVQSFARTSSRPCVHGALAADGSFGRAVWTSDFRVDDEPSSGAPTCEGGEHLPFIATVSGFVAMAVQQFLTKGAKVGYDVYPGGARKI